MDKKIINDTLGERIKHIRVNILKLNQSDFAHKIGLESPAGVSKYENGQREPDIATLLKIIHIAKVSADWLLTGEKAESAPLSPEVEKLVFILEHADPETKGFIKGVIESEYRKVEQDSRKAKKGA